MTLSFFGTLFTHMESWITEATLDHLAHPPPGSPGGAGGANSSAVPPPSAHSAQIEATLSRFLAAVLPVVAAQLRLGMERGELERCLNDLLHTMRFVGPLPGFKVRAWERGCAGICFGARSVGAVVCSPVPGASAACLPWAVGLRCACGASCMPGSSVPNHLIPRGHAHVHT